MTRIADDRVHYPLGGECVCGGSHAPVKSCSAGTSYRELVGVGRRIREVLQVDGNGAPTSLVWVRPEVMEKLLIAGLAVRVVQPDYLLTEDDDAGPHPGDSTVLGS